VGLFGTVGQAGSEREISMKHIVVLSLIIGCLGAPIQAQAQNAASYDEYMRRQQAIAQTLSNIANLRHQMMKTVAESLRLSEENAPPPEQNAPPTTPSYAPPTTHHYDPGQVQRQMDFNQTQTQNIINLMHTMSQAPWGRGPR
jgi:hypothetical protein